MNEETTAVAVPMVTAQQLAALQTQMLKYLSILASDERLEQSRTMIVQQALDNPRDRPAPRRPAVGGRRSWKRRSAN